MLYEGHYYLLMKNVIARLSAGSLQETGLDGAQLT